MIHKIYFHLSLYKFEIGLFVSLEKLWNVKFQAKQSNPLCRFQFLQNEGIQTALSEMMQWYSMRLQNILHEHNKYQQQAPVSLIKTNYEVVQPRRLVWFHHKECCLNFILCEGRIQVVILLISDLPWYRNNQLWQYQVANHVR